MTVANSTSAIPSLLAVEIEINHDCNRSCAYCPNSVAERKHQGRMPKALFLRVLDELRAIGYRGRVSFHFYNEPMLSPDLEHFVELTKQYLPTCWAALYTNGTLLTEDRLRTLAALGMNRFIVTRHHAETDYPFAELFPRLETMLRNKIKFLSHRELKLTNRGGLVKRAGRALGGESLSLPCWIPSASLVVTVSGNIIPCFEDYQEENCMGNIAERSLVDIWNSPRYADFRTSLVAGARSRFPVCRSCNNELVIP